MAHGNVANSPESIANIFNKYFSSKASDLKQNITDENLSFRQFLKNPITNSMHLNMVDAGELYSIIKSFKNKSTCDTKISALKAFSLSK